MDGDVTEAVRKALESAPDLRARNVDVKDCRPSYDIEADVTRVRMTLVFEIGKK